MLRQDTLCKYALLICTTVIFLNGCGGGITIKNDQRSVDDVIISAEQMVKAKRYADAAREYGIVILKEPTVGKHYLRRTEIMERIDQDEEAYEVYQQAMKMVPADDPHKVSIIHRLALINANHLFKIEEAEDLMQMLPEKSIEKYDTSAFLYYQASQYELAIKLLNKALERVRTADMKALLLYHAALIYAKLKDQKNLFGALYYSINNAQHLGLIRDIEQLWQELNKGPNSGDNLFKK